MTITPEQLLRLPQFARFEIARLTADNASMRADLDKVGWPGGTRVELDPSRVHLGKPRLFLPDTTVVRFQTVEGYSLDVGRFAGALEVRASARLVVHPKASNTIEIESVDL